MLRGVVMKSVGSQYEVLPDGGDKTLSCVARGRMRIDQIKSTNPVAVGDRVEVEPQKNGAGLITAVMPRRNCVVRRATNLSRQTHVLAANVDQALLVVTLDHPPTTTTFIDRFLASAEAYAVPVVMVFNKIDRYSADLMESLERLETLYARMDYPTMRISALNPDDIQRVRDTLKDKVSVIAGHSGVGKTTLVNMVQPGLNLKVDEISEANNQGKHTTTYAEMHPFSFGGYVIDTPGIRGFGIVNIEKAEVGHYFRDIFNISAGCKYNMCSHLHEPGCAVMAALDNGTLAPSRYQSYVNIMKESGAKYREPQ